MYYHFALVPINLALIAAYIIVRSRKDFKKIAIIQPLTTIVSMIIAGFGLMTSGAHTGYTVWILAGLTFSLIGDFINVEMNRDSVLMAGLIAFVFAYLTYSIGFTVYNGFHREDIYIGIVMVVVYIATMALLWPGLNGWKIPVLIYGLIMPFLLIRAISSFFGDFFTLTQSIFLTVGTCMLFIGDFAYGLERFRWKPPLFIGPFLYAGGQMLIALSTSFFS